MIKHFYLYAAGFFLSFTAIQGQTPISMDTAIEQALLHNPELRAQTSLFKAEQAGFWAAISPDSPRIFAEVEGVPVSGNWANDYNERKIGFAQEFDFPLAYWFHGSKARAAANQQRAMLDWTRSELTSRIKKQFVHILAIRTKQINLFEIQDLTEEMLQKARFRVLAGETAPYDSLKLSVERHSVANKVSRIQREYDLALQNLAFLIGWQNTEPFTITGQLEYHPVIFEWDEASSSEHPLVQQARFQEKQAAADRTLAWLDLLPKVEIRAFRIDIPEANPAEYRGGEIGLSFPFWGLFGGQGKIREAGHRAESSSWFRVLQQNKQHLQIAEARTAFDTAREQVETMQKSALREADELVRIATRSYEAGEMSYLDLTEALRTLSQIRTEYTNALNDYYVSLFDLETATGRAMISTDLFNTGGTK